MARRRHHIPPPRPPLMVENHNNFQILQYNVQKRLNAVQIPLLNDPEVREFDILALQEPGRSLNASETHNTSSTQFHLVNCPGKTFRTCIYVNKRIDTKTWSVEAAEDDFCSIRIVIRNNDGSTKAIRLHNVYNPSPNSTTSVNSPSTLPRLVKAIEENPEDTHMVVGDFNLHHPYWGGPRCFSRHAAADHLIDVATQATLDLLTPPGTITREMNQQKTTIDLAFGQDWVVNRLLRCSVRADIHQGSDHLPIVTELQLRTTSTPAVKRRLWKEMDSDLLRKTLAAILPAERPLDTREEIEKYAADIQAAIQKAVDTAVPWARPSGYAKDFWTPQCTEGVERARRRRAEWLQTGTEEAWEDYTQATHTKSTIIRKARRAFFRAQIHEMSDNPASIMKIAKWARTKSFLPKERPQFPPLKRGQSDGEAREFAEKVEILRRKFFPPPAQADLSDIAGFQYPPPIPVREGGRVDPLRYTAPGAITLEEVAQAIRRPKADKAPGVSQITNRVLQEGLPELAPKLVWLFNACVKKAYHPRIFKQANTVVLRKPRKKDYTDPRAYRPIALLDTVGKALETILARRISDIAEDCGLLPATQMGARRKRSTESALELLVEQVHTVWSGGSEHVASILSLDVAGAFDNVSHERLLHNLRKRKIPGNIVDWVQSFLQERESCLSFDGTTSEMSSVHAGIPQGSPISPILFLFFNADLVEGCESLGLKTSAIGFVDDVNILAYGRSTEDNCRTLSRVHDTCTRWARTHGATFAPEKYELIHLTRKPGRFNMTAGLRIDSADIQPKTDIRILGVQLDTKLRWGPHLREVEGKNATQMLAMSRLGASTWGATFARARTIYTTVVRPALTYGASVWHNRGTTGRLAGKEKRLELLQNQALRNITGGFKKLSTRTLEAETYVPPIGHILNQLQDQATLRARITGREQETRSACAVIRSKQGLGARRRKPTPGKQKQSHLRRAQGSIITGDPPGNTRAPAPPNAGDKAIIAIFHRAQWEKEWESYRQRIPTAHRSPAQSQPIARKSLGLRSGLRKAESTLATHIRTERIGLRAYLHSRGVPGFDTPDCSCQLGRQTAKHVLRFCPEWKEQRKSMMDAAGTQDYREITASRKGLRAAAKMMMKTGLLEQFALANTLLYGEV